MDYSNHSKAPYGVLLSKFHRIGEVLVKKLEQFKEEGFDFNQGFMFGFSFGGRLVTYAGIQMNGEIANIDTCDSAGPGFDGTFRVKNSFQAAQNVQCINTSIDKGTRIYDCDQNCELKFCNPE